MSVIQEVQRLLTEAEKSRTWGQIEISLQDGRPIIIKETTTHRLTENPSENRTRTLRN